MKKGLIVVNAYADLKGISYQSTRLSEELKKRCVDCEVVKPHDLHYGVSDGKIFLEEKPDFAIFLDKDKYLSRMIESVGIRCFNSAQAIELCDDKMLTYLALADHGVPMPKTIPSMLCYTQNKEVSKIFLSRVEKTCSYPLIAKTSFGSLGKGVFLIRNEEELLQTEKELQFVPHLYQEYLGFHKGEDIRIIVIGGKAVACMRRRNDGDFRSNVEIGGVGENIKPKESFIKLAEKAASVLNLDYCGVDLLIGKGEEPVLCEVNSNAFFTGIENVTGIDIAARYVEYIINNI